ncbi:uncharacterized protein LOC144477483, partial [Augochlora pura]
MAKLFEEETTVLQINLHRCKMAQDLMVQYALENDVNIVIISEPYSIMDNWYGDTNQDAAIWVTSRTLRRNINIHVFAREKGVVAVKIDEISIFSCYISPNIQMDEFREILATIEAEVIKAGPNLSLIAGDLNAKAVSWGSKFTDKRGFEILEMSSRNDIIPTRSRGDYTFDRAGRRSLIDILLCGRECVTALRSSDILDDFTASDHKYLKHVFIHKTNDIHSNRGKTQQTKTTVDKDKFIAKYQDMLWTSDTIHMDTIMDID